MEYQPIPSPRSGSVPFQFLNSPFGDTTYTKVFVGGLAWETKSDTLRQHFEQYGDILEAVVISDKHTGRSKGYGFVTFRDPDAARRACADPTPVIDGRRANCNLASLGRARPPVPFGRPRQTPEDLGSVQAVRGPYVGNFGYQQQQQPISYGYQQQAYLYPPPYGYAAYSPEYLYSQGIYSPYMGQQQYLQVYGVPGTGNSTVYPYGQLSQAVPGGHGYWTMQGYPVSGHQIVRFPGQGVNAAANPPSPMSQTSYPAGIAAAIPSPQHLRFPAPAPQPRSMQGGDSDRTAG